MEIFPYLLVLFIFNSEMYSLAKETSTIKPKINKTIALEKVKEAVGYATESSAKAVAVVKKALSLANQTIDSMKKMPEGAQRDKIEKEAEKARSVITSAMKDARRALELAEQAETELIKAEGTPNKEELQDGAKKIFESLALGKKAIRKADMGAKDALGALLMITTSIDDGQEKRKVELLMKEDNTLMRTGFTNIWSLIRLGLDLAKEGIDVLMGAIGVKAPNEPDEPTESAKEVRNW